MILATQNSWFMDHVRGHKVLVLTDLRDHIELNLLGNVELRKLRPIKD